MIKFIEGNTLSDDNLLSIYSNYTKIVKQMRLLHKLTSTYSKCFE